MLNRIVDMFSPDEKPNGVEITRLVCMGNGEMWGYCPVCSGLSVPSLHSPCLDCETAVIPFGGVVK